MILDRAAESIHVWPGLFTLPVSYQHIRNDFVHQLGQAKDSSSGKCFSANSYCAVKRGSVTRNTGWP